MIKKISLLVVLFLTAQWSFSQSVLDEYKYVIVPDTYEFCKERDQYQLNSLTKFLFEKQGFIALMSDEPLPQDLVNNGCLALSAEVLDESTSFVTKFKIQLKNCNKQVVYTSRLGQSRDKKNKVAFNIALRQAFESFDSVDYSYKPAKVTTIAPVLLTAETESVPATKINDVATKTDTNQALTARAKGAVDYELLNDKGKVIYTLIFSGKQEFYMVEGMQATVFKKEANWIIAKRMADGSIQEDVLNVTF